MSRALSYLELEQMEAVCDKFKQNAEEMIQEMRSDPYEQQFMKYHAEKLAAEVEGITSAVSLIKSEAPYTREDLVKLLPGSDTPGLLMSFCDKMCPDAEHAHMFAVQTKHSMEDLKEQAGNIYYGLSQDEKLQAYRSIVNISRDYQKTCQEKGWEGIYKNIGVEARINALEGMAKTEIRKVVEKVYDSVIEETGNRLNELGLHDILQELRTEPELSEKWCADAAEKLEAVPLIMAECDQALSAIESEWGDIGLRPSMLDGRREMMSRVQDLVENINITSLCHVLEEEERGVVNEQAAELIKSTSNKILWEGIVEYGNEMRQQEDTRSFGISDRANDVLISSKGNQTISETDARKKLVENLKDQEER